MSLRTKLEELWLSVRHGAVVEVANEGRPIDQVTIKCRGYYLFVDFDGESGEPTGGFGWSDDPTLNPTVPVRDVLVAEKRS